MRHAAILLMLLGCSAGPSVVSDPPPVPVVVEPVEAPLPDAIDVEIAKKPDVLKDAIEEWLADHPKPADSDESFEDMVEEWLDKPTPRPDSFQAIAAEAVRRANRQGSLDSCDCGGDCRCEPECNCPGCDCTKSAKSATRYLAVISADWCGPCRTIHAEHAATPGVRFVDFDRERSEAIRLWGGTPAQVPAFVLVVDGEPIKRWSASSRHQPWIEGMRDFQSVEGSQPTHDATPNDSGKAGDSPLSYLRVRGIRGAQQYNASCVAVARDLVLTNSHVVRDEGRLLPTYRVWIGGEWHDAAFVADDVAADLALLRVAGASLSPVALAERPPYGTVETHGYAFGAEYTNRKPVVSLTLRLEDGRQATARHRWFVQTRFEIGESGGAVTQDGRLVGLVTGNEPLAGLIVDLPSIRAFLARQGVL